MNFQNAVVLVLAVFGLTEFGKRFLGAKLSSNPRIVAGLAIVVGQAAVWLVGTTAWAHEQVIGSKPLDELNTGSKVLVGFFAAGVAAFGAEFLSTVRNVGDNQPLPLHQVLKQIEKTPDVHAGQTTTRTATASTAVPITFADDAQPNV
jgi:hypothetical protein